MASLYGASERGSLLQAWPLLYDSVRDFRADASTEFDKLTWKLPQRSRLAHALRTMCHAALPELFRTAAWSEWQNGYEEFWHRRVAPRSMAYRACFARRVRELTDALPELADVEWVLCHPLRFHGRLLRAARPVIAVGVADPQFGVTELLPVMQGCHECMVKRVQDAAPAAGAWSSRRGRAGYAEFRRVEDTALAEGARCWLGSAHEGAYLSWLGRVFPGQPAAETAAQLASRL
jgi:hypothetical protein